MKKLKLDLQRHSNMPKKAYRINVENLVYAVLEKDSIEEVQYGEVKKLAEVMQIQVTPTVASGQLYGDGVKVSTITKLTGMTVVMDMTKVPIKTRSELLGSTYEGGILAETGNDIAKDIAIGYRIPHDVEGVAEYVWILKGRAQPYGSTVGQATDSINYSTDSMTIEFIPREDGNIRFTADSSDPDFNEELMKTWFKEVPSGPVKNEVIEP